MVSSDAHTYHEPITNYRMSVVSKNLFINWIHVLCPQRRFYKKLPFMKSFLSFITFIYKVSLVKPSLWGNCHKLLLLFRRRHLTRSIHMKKSSKVIGSIQEAQSFYKCACNPTSKSWHSAKNSHHYDLGQKSTYCTLSCLSNCWGNSVTKHVPCMHFDCVSATFGYFEHHQSIFSWRPGW